MSIPDQRECERLWELNETPQRVQRHCHAVMLRACRLLEEFEGLWRFDEDLVVAGALLHDMCRAQPDHAQVAAQRLEALGMPEVARVVSCHMHLEEDMLSAIDERAIVFLADKMVIEDTPCTIEARYLNAALHGADMEVMEMETARVKGLYERLKRGPEGAPA